MRAWYKANSDHINKYQSIVEHSLVSLSSMLDDDIIYCCNPACTAHHNNLSRCVISSLIALKLLQTVQSLAKVLANVPSLLAGHNLSNQNYRQASGGIKYGLILVPLWLVFCFRSKSTVIANTSMLSDG